MKNRGGIMATEIINAVGLRCPQPVLKVAAKAPDMKPGDILEVLADCPTFERDVRVWCERMKRTLLWTGSEEGGIKKAQIQF